MKRRALSAAIALALCLNMVPVLALDSDVETGGGLCPHHPAHTDACGYAAPTLGQECNHDHDDSCYTTETVCTHEHTAGCYPEPAERPEGAEGSEADGETEAAPPLLCTHECTEESGCVTRVLSCSHEHDDACGYVPGTPGAPCTFVCRICPIEARISQLPGSVSASNIEQVQAGLGEIFQLYEELTPEEQQQIDLSPCVSLLDQIDGLDTEVQSDSGAQSDSQVQSTSSDEYILDADHTVAYEVTKRYAIWLNTHSFIVENESALRITENGDLTLTGPGGVRSENGAGVEVVSGGALHIVDPSGPDTIEIRGTTYAVKVAAGAKASQVSIPSGTYFGNINGLRVEFTSEQASSDTAVNLSGGTYTGNGAGIWTNGDYADLLAPGYAYFDKDGNPIVPADVAKNKIVTVAQCAGHSARVCIHNPGTTTHTWTCPYCGASEAEEPCTFDFTGETGVCADCGSRLAVSVNIGDLRGFVYDGVPSEENVGITVTLTNAGGGSTKELVKETDYTVAYAPDRYNAEVTVTVTSGKFNGTFTKTYSVAKPVPSLVWSAASKSVDYDGSPVEAGDLPSVTISGVSDGDALKDALQYSYKRSDSTGDFINGLPTDAGTYLVKASLEEADGYTAAETNPCLTLTVNKISPLITAPAAVQPTFDRNSHELITAGVVRDGAVIEYARTQGGPYSTDIPTEINAGDYEVWYQIAETENYVGVQPTQVSDVKILRKQITPIVKLSQYSYLYDGGEKQPTVTVLDEDNVTVLLDTEYAVTYENNRDVSTDANPAKAVVTDKTPAGGNYDITTVEVEFKITIRTQDTLSITQKPDTVTYGDQFTLSTTGGSDSGSVTWEITAGADVAEVGQNSGQITIIGDGTATVKATKSGGGNYEDAIATWEFTAVKKPVTATVTAEDKPYDGSATATVHAVVESGVLAGDEIKIENLTGTFSDENAGTDKTVTVITTGATITGHNSEHYAVSYSSTTVKATIHKAVVKITTAPVPASLTYNGTARPLIAAEAVVDTAGVLVEYALSETGPYSTDFPKGTNAGDYTVWYRIQETPNYTGLAPASVDVTIAKKPVSPTITLDQDSFVYDGTAKEPSVTLYEADGTTVIPAGEYTVAYSDNVNVGTATVTVTAKDDGNYSFTSDPVTKDFTISPKQAQVLTAPEPAGRPLFFTNYNQQLVTAGTAEGGTMVYRVGDTGDFEPGIPEETDAGTYKVYYKVQGDSNHSDSDVCSMPVTVTIAPKTVNDPTIELQNDNGTPFVSCTYDGTEMKPTVVVKDGSDIIGVGEYEIVYSDNKDAGRATVSITDKPGGNYTVTGHTTFEILKADIVFSPAPSAATLTYNGEAQPLLNAGATTGGTVYYALGTSTSEYHDYIPTGVDAGSYEVYYKVTGDKNHNDFSITKVTVTIGRKPLTAPTIELTPNSFEYDGAVHLPAVTVKDGDTVLPASEYAWACNDNAPTQGGTYTITVTDKTGGNYDLTGVVAPNNTADFTIGKAAQAELTIEGKRDPVYYGDTFQLTAGGGSGTGAVTWSATGAATVDASGNVTINDVGEVTISVAKAGDTNYEPASAQWTFTAAPKPVTASVTVNNKPYDGTTTATVTAASIPTLTGDTVTIDPASITAVFDDPHAGTGKTVTLDTSNVQVTGDTTKYAISYPATVTANITQATTTIDTAPEKIDPLTYSGQPQALVTAGQTNVGFLVYSLDGTSFSPEIPTGTDAGTYNVYYKVDGTADYTSVAVNTTPISVTIDPKPITPKIELSQSSYLYDGTKKEPKITVKDGDTVLHEDQYTFAWANTDASITTDILVAAGTYKATVTNVPNGNYTFTAETEEVKITPATQAALSITGQPEHVYYGDTIATLGTTGGTGQGTVKWSVTAGSATIEESTGKLTITGTGSVTVKAERTVPNYGTVSDTWTFTVEPKPVTAEVTVAAKTYDGTTDVADTAITAQVKASDLVGGDTVTLSGLKGAYSDPNAGTGKPVTLDSTGATADNTGKYAVSYPAMATGDINPKSVTVTVTLSDHDLKTETTGDTTTYYYDYNGTDRTPNVTVTADDNHAVLTDSDYSVKITDNKNVGDATVTVTAKADGNYTFTALPVNFEIRSAAAVLVSSPQAKDLTYEKGTEQELVTVGVATGGTVVYSLSPIDPDDEDTYSETIPKGENAGTYTVYYMVKGDSNHADTTPQQMTATIKPKQITPAITLDTTSYVYDGNAKTPTVTVGDGTETISTTEYSVSYRDNVNAGTATVTVSNENGGNYIVNGTASFEITKAAPTVTAPTGKTGLYYTGELQDLVTAGVTSHGTVVYSVDGGNYVPTIPTASAVKTYTIDWKVQGDGNHSDTTPATLSVEIAKNTVTNPTITLSQDQFTYDGNQHRPTVTVYDNNSRLIPEYEYTATITPGKSTNISNVVDVDTYTVTIAAAANSNYEFTGTVTRTFEIVAADQETISITGTKAQVRYGDEIQLGVSGGAGSGTVKWEITGNTDTTLTQGGLLTVKDVNTPITVTVTRSRDNYSDVSATWEFTAAKKPVTAEVTVAAKPYDGNISVASTAITATVKAADLAFTGDNITITGLTGTYDNANVGTGKTVTLTGGTVGGTNAEKYDVTIPATATASILGVAATVDTEPTANTLTYDASQSQELVTAGTATGGTMVYSLDGTNFTPNIPKGKDAGNYKVYYKAQGDQNHTDSAVGTVDVTIDKQTVTPQIELSPPSGQYDGKVQQPAVTVRDTANNVIPTSEYKVTYVTDGGKNWTDQGTYTVKVENITGGNYIVNEKDATFTISTSAQAPLEIVNKPGLVYYGDTFTLSATGGSSSSAVTWNSSNTSIADIDSNGFVTIKGTGSATITATKAGGGNYDTATATYPLNALKKPATATFTADDKVYDGKTDATIHITWNGLVGSDIIDTSHLSGTFDNANVGANKTVTITGDYVDDATAQKYDITIHRTTTASITKAAAAAPAVTANSGLTYTGSAQALVTGGDTNTLYSTSRDGVYSAGVPTETNAGTYTIWYKEQGDANHSDSEPQSCTATINPKTLTPAAADIVLSGSDLKTDNGTCYYDYDGTDKTPTVTVKDGAATVPASEYTVTYSDNRNVTTAGKKATVTIADNEGGNYIVSGSTTFEIRAGSAELTSSPQAKDLTYTGTALELVTVGTATGGHLEYKLTSVPAGEPTPGGSFGRSIPTGTNAGTYTVEYKVVGDDNHTNGPSGSVTVIIQPKTVISPNITVDGTYNYTYDGNAKTPTVTVVDGTDTIDTSEYTLSYQNNTNAGTATVIVIDNNGGNYTVNGTATFEIGKAAAAVGTAPTGKTSLHYNGSAQELLDTLGTANGGTLVYSLVEDGEYSAAIPTGKAVGEYEIWYKVLGDGNHSDSAATKLADKVKIEKNTVINPTINVTPPTVKYTGEKQEPNITVKDDNGLLINGSEYTVTYADTANSNNSDLIQVGTYTVTITGVTNGNYTFNTTKTATFTVTPADQTALTITGTRERVYYGDTIPLGTTGGDGTVTWTVDNSSAASINESTGLLNITGTGSVTVTATGSKTGYADQTATWQLHAERKPVTAAVTAAAKTYDGSANAAVTATLQGSDFVGTDSFTITLNGCTFEDANAGTDKKVNVDSTSPTFTVNAGGTDNHENYAITYLATATASIFKADIAAADVTAPTLVTTGLTYTGLPQALITAAGTATGGTMEYSLDGETYSTGLPTGTDAGNYDVWYRVKGDGNHNDTAGKKLDTQVTIAPQSVADPTIEFNPSGASYDGQVHKPAVIVKDGHNRVIPAEEYIVTYSDTDWKTASSAAVKHKVTVTDKDGGNYQFDPKTEEFTISMMGQNPLSITNQPGEVRYGDSFTLSTTGGSGTGAVTWTSSDTSVATIGTNGLVKTLKSGATTITATKEADANYGAVSVTWALSVEKKPVTAIVTARNKPYDGDTTAILDVSWTPGDVLSADVSALTTALKTALSGKFNSADAGDNKIVTITLNGTLPDGDGKYAITYNTTTTASITAQAATVSGSTPTTLTYDGSAQALVTGVAATNGTIVYSRNGVDFMETSPTETNAGRYTVYYKARGNTNYADSDVRMVEVTIQPKTVTSPAITLASDSVAYDGSPKEPDVVSVKDGSDVIPASEYTVSYSNNISVGTTARVTITDVPGGNYTVSGSRNFTITAGAASLVSAPQPNNRVYDGTAQPLVTAGSAVNGKVVYSLTQGSGYSTSIPVKTDADTYTVWYKVQGENGAADTAEDYVKVTISRKPITPTVLVGGQSSYSVTYTGSAQTPAVTVIVDGKPLTQNVDYTALYSNNTNVGTATVTVQSTGGNYQFYVPVTFEITKAKATFAQEPRLPIDDLYYTGEPQELVRRGTANNGGIVLYSLDNATYSTAIPKGTERGTYTVYAKVQGSETYAESDIVIVDVEIAKNVVTAPLVELSDKTLPFTGSKQEPTVTIWDDDDYVIDSSEYTVRYSNNTNVGTATVTITCKRNGNYSFDPIIENFQIVDASQTPLAITGKPEGTVYYGDTLSLGTTGGGSGTVTWSATGPVDRLGDGQYKVTSSGSVTITATKGGSTDTWTFVAKPKPVTATVYAADKVYDNSTTATLTVTLSGLLPGDNVTTVTATGSFIDEKAGTNKTVLITGLNVSDEVRAKYDISYNSTTTASITPKPASVTGSVTGKNLTYNGTAQALIDVSGATAEGGNLAYSLDGNSYTFSVPTAADVGTYPIWYKVVASSENYKDSAPVKVTQDAVISANQDTPQVRCDPSSLPYDGTAKAPTVVVLDSTGQHTIPESEYTVEFPANAIATGSYTVTVKDRAGGNYQFNDVTGSFEIVASSQAPVSITDKPANVHYGDTFYLSATGGSGSGAIQWSVEGTAATVNDSGAVTVNGTGSFTVKAYREASGGYTQSNTDSVTFVAQPKPVTPVVRASDKSYNGSTDAALTASVRTSDLVNSTDNVTLSVSGVFASADAGVGKRVDLTTRTVTGADAAKYTINWPDYVTATINRVDAKISAVPTAVPNLRENGSAQQLVSPGTTENNIGTIVYSLSQNGVYSSDIPTGTAAGVYTVWYQVADSVNYNGVAPASILVRIEIGTDSSSSDSDSSDSSYSAGVTENSGTNGVGDAQTTYSAPAAVQDGTANTVLRASEGASMVRQAAANKSQSIVIKPEIAGEVTKSQVSIPSSTVSRIQSETDAALTVSAPIADVTIPNAALDTLSSAGGTVDVATEQVGDAVKLTLTAGGEAVEEVPGGVTLSVPAEDAGPGTVAVLVKEDGTREVIQKSVAKDGAVNVPLNGSATVELVDNSKEFEDVPAESWAADAVAFASARELFNGTSETTFSPDEDMSRGMLATVLYNLEGSPDQDTAVTFSDIDSDAWYADGVAWAAESGITSGYGDGQFGPDDSITREQFAVMLWKYAGSPAASDQALAFTDADQVNSYAQEALCWAVENRIMSGYADGKLAPGDTATRAQAAQMLKNFMENA